MAVEDDMLRKNPFDFELADVLINDSVKRLEIKEELKREMSRASMVDAKNALKKLKCV